ncbi:MFS transporter [Nonomuraea sp. ATR24]|uniref:MFS transporter n=1 Tax=Nonomuraea TaxID=83681 RepID=UPI001C5D6F66|nr:MFS transporter [Nonomuraea ceibae]
MVKAVTRERRRLGSPPAGGISPTDPNPYGWAPFAVLFLVGIVDRMEAGLLAGVLPLIQEQWGFSDTAAGSIPTAGALAATAVALPAGYLADRYSRTKIIAVVVLCWGLATLGSGLAAGFAVFYLMRVLLAAAENIDNPAMGSLIADFYPAAARVHVYGWTRMTTYLSGLGTIVGGVIGQAYGWRAAFLCMAVPGILTALLVWRLREPERGRLDRIRASAGDAPATGAAPPDRPALASPPFWRQVREVLAVRTLVRVSVGVMILTLGLGGIYYWLPTLLSRAYGLPIGTAGTTSGLVTIVGVVAGTVIGGRLGRRAITRHRAGLLLVGGAGITAGSLLLGGALLMGSATAMILCVLLAVTVSATAIPTCTASVADVVGARSRGLGFAVLQFLLTLGAAFGPLIVGITSDATGSLVTAMYALIVPMVLGGLLVLSARGSYERESAKVLDEARDL